MDTTTHEYTTEDGGTVHTGDLVYDYYSMEPVIIGEDTGDGEWFDTLRPGSVDESHPRGVRSTSGMLNGARICTLSFAVRRGFKDVPQCEWFALCDNSATGTRSHPVLGQVPICGRCNRKVEAMA